MGVSGRLQQRRHNNEGVERAAARTREGVESKKASVAVGGRDGRLGAKQRGERGK